MPAVSVIVCAHNPRQDYGRRMLDALRAQTLAMQQWEFLCIDNASKICLADIWDLAWHPRARHIREDELGLTCARLRGIAESIGDLLIFVDDDNVLAPEFLAEALKIAERYPQIGAFGGAIDGEFEKSPPATLMPFTGLLALREVSRAVWGNRYETAATPFGAGLCLRRDAATTYFQSLKLDQSRRDLDRLGDHLASCGDFDLAWTAIDLGFGVGLFPELRLTHLIAARRCDLNYLIDLNRSISESTVILHYARRLSLDTFYPSWSWNKRLFWQLQAMRLSRIRRSFLKAEWEGAMRGWKRIGVSGE